jgi:hypothetical protein
MRMSNLVSEIISDDKRRAHESGRDESVDHDESGLNEEKE